MATFVEGEAAETDSSDDEQYVFNLSYMKVFKEIYSIEFKIVNKK